MEPKHLNKNVVYYMIVIIILCAIGITYSAYNWAEFSNELQDSIQIIFSGIAMIILLMYVFSKTNSDEAEANKLL